MILVERVGAHQDSLDNIFDSGPKVWRSAVIYNSFPRILLVVKINATLLKLNTVSVNQS